VSSRSLLAVLLLVLAGAAALAAGPEAPEAPAQSSPSPRVDAMVVGRAGVLYGPRRVTARRTLVRAGRARCIVRQGTPLSVLAAVDRLRGGPSVRLRDFGTCNRRRTRDSGGLYVSAVGGQAARGRNGWVFKVGTRAGITPAADPNGPFGDDRFLRTGQRVVWFWCVLDEQESCQRSLTVEAPAAVAVGAPVVLRVRGHDDAGEAVDVAGATVRLGAASATTGPDGTATLTAPAAAGAVTATATAPGLVPAFPERVAVR
jgi:hypothetical protein